MKSYGSFGLLVISLRKFLRMGVMAQMEPSTNDCSMSTGSKPPGFPVTTMGDSDVLIPINSPLRFNTLPPQWDISWPKCYWLGLEFLCYTTEV